MMIQLQFRHKAPVRVDLKSGSKMFRNSVSDLNGNFKKGLASVHGVRLSVESMGWIGPGEVGLVRAF